MSCHVVSCHDVSCCIMSCHVMSCHVVRLCVITVASYGATNELLTKPNRAPPPQRPNTHQTITKPHLPAPMNQWTLPHGNHQQHFSATACAPPPLHFAHNHNTLDNTLDLFVTLASFICLCLCVCCVCLCVVCFCLYASVFVCLCVCVFVCLCVCVDVCWNKCANYYRCCCSCCSCCCCCCCYCSTNQINKQTNYIRR